jgi:hypothetical protein
MDLLSPYDLTKLKIATGLVMTKRETERYMAVWRDLFTDRSVFNLMLGVGCTIAVVSKDMDKFWFRNECYSQYSIAGNKSIVVMVLITYPDAILSETVGEVLRRLADAIRDPARDQVSDADKDHMCISIKDAHVSVVIPDGIRFSSIASKPGVTLCLPDLPAASMSRGLFRTIFETTSEQRAEAEYVSLTGDTGRISSMNMSVIGYGFDRAERSRFLNMWRSGDRTVAIIESTNLCF